MKRYSCRMFRDEETGASYPLMVLDDIGDWCLYARVAELEEAATALIDKLEAVAEYQNVREGFMVGHGMPYAGPTYNEERDRLRRAIGGGE